MIDLRMSLLARNLVNYSVAAKKRCYTLFRKTGSGVSAPEKRRKMQEKKECVRHPPRLFAAGRSKRFNQPRA